MAAAFKPWVGLPCTLGNERPGQPILSLRLSHSSTAQPVEMMDWNDQDKALHVPRQPNSALGDSSVAWGKAAPPEPPHRRPLTAIIRISKILIMIINHDLFLLNISQVKTMGHLVKDHFKDNDTALHAWESIAQILLHPDTKDILLDVGSPVLHRNVLYNCRIIILNGKILLIRPKLWLVNDGNYREERFFTG
jgi:hypothetical protein